MFSGVFKELTIGSLRTLEIFILTLVGAVPLGLIITFGSMSRFSVIKKFVRFIIWIVRGTPLMLQLILVYYGPGLVLHKNIWGMGSQGRFVAVICAFVFNYACYFSEIFRGGIEGISKGQREAGYVLGLSNKQIFFKVILLQLVKSIVPPMGNEIITLVKDTSIARVVAVYELIYRGQGFIKSAGIIWPLFMTGVYYLVFSGVLTLVLGKIEKKLSYFK